MRKKITIVGAGMVGLTCAKWAVVQELGDVVLIDIDAEMTQGKALDLLEATPVFGSDCKVVGGSDYTLTKNSDVVVMAAGLPRKPGMSRDELLSKNTSIVKTCTEQVVKYSPNCILIVVSNPLDAMAYVAYKVSGFPKNRIIGMAGVLDSSRFKTFIAQIAFMFSIAGINITDLLSGILPDKFKDQFKLIIQSLFRLNIKRINFLDSFCNME
ncbi:hypothetical protein HYT52_03830 [Candidatus Woesearchaeota archaeon]|nr:hypothetical protein [Candidatus Woesearchaeota archaeon]